MHLGAQEFAVHEGGEDALFAVVAGKIEVVKLIDGIERTLGWRVPGTIFGEVPIALGTPFPGGLSSFDPFDSCTCERAQPRLRREGKAGERIQRVRPR